MNRVDVWQSWEDKFLRKNYKRYNLYVLAQHLPGRTWLAVKHRLYLLGLNRSEGLVTMVQADRDEAYMEKCRQELREAFDDE